MSLRQISSRFFPRIIRSSYVLLTAVACQMQMEAATVAVTNHSFEFPETEFASPIMDAWQKAPQPFWYDDQGGFFPWDQLIGQFLNSTNGSPNHIDNMEGRQAAYLFALPQVTIFLDHTTNPTNGFNARFEAGKSYTLTVGVLGGGGGMSNGATFQISLYYRDADSNKVPVAVTTITNTPALFPTNTHFTDFQVVLPAVKPSDAWVGRNIGIELASAIGLFDNLAGGYWDVDNVRLEVFQSPSLTPISHGSGHFNLLLEGDPGPYEILASSDVALALSNWNNLGTVTNQTGSVLFTDTNAVLDRRFYQARPAQ